MKILETPVVRTVCNAAKTVYKTLQSEFSVLLFAGTNIVKGMQGIGLVAIENSVVKLALSIGTLVKSTIESLGTIPKMHEVTQLRKNLFDVLKDPKTLTTRRSRIENMTKACEYIRDNQKQIRNILGVAKDAGILQRAESALERKTSLEDSEQFLKTLRRRVNLQFGVNLAKLVTRTASVGASIALIASAPNPITLSIAGVCGLATLGTWAFEKIFLPKNPFDAPKDVWYETIPHKIRSTAFKISDRIEQVFNRTATSAVAA